MHTSNEEAQPPTLIVGIGASAGGLQAISTFLDSLPDDTGFAFVIVTHHPPTRSSLLPTLLSKRSHMAVVEVTEPTTVQANRVYVSPPADHLVIIGDVLQFEPDGADGEREPLAINRFFSSLAKTGRAERAVGIVLSGGGSDGTLGLKQIRLAGGLTLAQTEHSAQFASMPNSAFRHGAVDYVLDPSSMPAQLLAYASGIAQSIDSKPASRGSDAALPSEDALAVILRLLRGRVGHDFSSYKHSSIRRRIDRRVRLHGLVGAQEYAAFLETRPEELDALLGELLIGVTSFFRDAEAFSALAKAASSLVCDTEYHAPLRAWVAGCASGEEAYSIAILLRELMVEQDNPRAIQIFATDLDARAIECARAGVYSESIEAQVSRERLTRFFTKTDGFYRTKKKIRDMVVFAEHNLISDPPFTKMDLIVCRNVLIYMNGALQARLLPTFHYALNPRGLLLLGPSEALGNFTNLFDAIDDKWKLFRRLPASDSDYPLELRRGMALRATPRELSAPNTSARPAEQGIGHLVERALLQHLVPPSVLVQARGDIIHIHGRTAAFLEPFQGFRANVNILNMARPGLRSALAGALREATQALDGDPVTRRGIRARANGEVVSVDFSVKRLASPEALNGLLLISFEHVEREEHESAEQPVSPAVDRVSTLEQQLFLSQQEHHGTLDELDQTNQELKSMNEELQSTNEEFQSTNEELETSKEEMQSMNEELHSVNSELLDKVTTLQRANDDMKNLLNATRIAMVFLDQQLRIVSYTEPTTRVIRLIASDVGRPIGDLVSRLRYETLAEDCQGVLRTLELVEQEVQGDDDSWYLMRILPYRTTENSIEGVAVTFDDVTLVRQLRERGETTQSALEQSSTSAFIQNLDLVCEWVSGAIFGAAPQDAAGKGFGDLLSAPSAARLDSLSRDVLDSHQPAHARLRLSRVGEPQEFECQVHVALRRDTQGAIIGTKGVITELSSLSG